MKFKGRESNAWHKNIDDTAGPRKPIDPDFPWIALQNHTGCYMKKKGKSSQLQTDEHLLALIRDHSSKEVAIAACAHSISTQAIRNLLANDLKAKSDSTFAYSEYLKGIVATYHVNSGAVSEIEAQWTHHLLKHVAAGAYLCTLGQQVHDLLPFLSARMPSGLFLQTDITGLAYDLCRDFAKQLENWRNENQWTDAHASARWLSTDSTSALLQIPNSEVRELLDSYLPTWAAWAAWRPHVARMHAWKDYAILAPSCLEDLFALEGPDFASMVGSEQATLRKGLIAQGSRGSQSKLNWANHKSISEEIRTKNSRI